MPAVQKDLPDADYYCLSQDPISKVFATGVRAEPWQKGLQQLFLLQN